MRKNHQWLVLGIVVMFALIWVITPTLFGLSGLDVTLWHTFMSIVILAVLIPSTYFLKPDRIIVAIFLGEIYRAYAPDIHGEKERSSDLHRGILGTDIALIFPPLLARGYHFPLTAFTLPLVSVGANTAQLEDEAVTPVTVFLSITIRLAPSRSGLQQLIQGLPSLLENGADLASFTAEMNFYSGMEKDGTPKQEKRRCVKIAKLLAHALQPTIDEAISRAVAQYSLSKGLQSKKEIEEAVKLQLAGTIIEQAGLISVSNRKKAKVGDACLLFDVNLAEIIPSDKDTALAISSETRAKLTAKGGVATAQGSADAKKILGDGDAAYLRKVAQEASTEEGKLVLASQTLQNLPQGANVFVGTTSVLDALVAKGTQPPAGTTPPASGGSQ